MDKRDYLLILLKKSCSDIIGAGDLGVSPGFKKSPKIVGSGGD